MPPASGVNTVANDAVPPSAGNIVAPDAVPPSAGNIVAPDAVPPSAGNIVSPNAVLTSGVAPDAAVASASGVPIIEEISDSVSSSANTTPVNTPAVDDDAVPPSGGNIVAPDAVLTSGVAPDAAVASASGVQEIEEIFDSASSSAHTTPVHTSAVDAAAHPLEVKKQKICQYSNDIKRPGGFTVFRSLLENDEEIAQVGLIRAIYHAFQVEEDSLIITKVIHEAWQFLGVSDEEINLWLDKCWWNGDEGWSIGVEGWPRLSLFCCKGLILLLIIGNFVLHLLVILVGAADIVGNDHPIFSISSVDDVSRKWLKVLFDDGSQIPFLYLQGSMTEALRERVRRGIARNTIGKPEMIPILVIYEALELMSKTVLITEPHWDLIGCMYRKVMGPDKRRDLFDQSNSSSDLEKCYHHFPSASSLKKAKIRLSKLKCPGYSKISFSDFLIIGDLSIPVLVFDKCTEVVISCLKKYEERRDMQRDFTAYLRVIKDLTPTFHDLDILQKAGIVHVVPGTDEKSLIERVHTLAGDTPLTFTLESVRDDIAAYEGPRLLLIGATMLNFEISPYLEELTKTGGAIQEFVNPKYKDSTKSALKSSTRLECMMQDYPKTLPPSARVGFTVMEA